MGSLGPLGCSGCGRPEPQTGEQRIYPPDLRRDEFLGLIAPRYCGPCAVREAVADKQKTERPKP